MKPLLLVLAGLAAEPARAQVPPASPPEAAQLPAATALPPAAEQRVARELFADLMGMDTSAETGSTTVAAEYLARLLRKAGFAAADVKVLGPSPKKQNLVARLHGGGGKRKPLMLLGHLDVVQARRSDWSLEPYHLTEKDGYFYGRGTQDMKSQVAIWVATVLRLKREKLPLDRDILLVLTADEERGGESVENGVHWLLQHDKGLIDAELALNEGGGGEIKAGRRRANDVQASEKGYLSFRLEVHNKGGHSSLPDKDNAIVHLAEGLVRLGKHQFPARLDPVMRLYFQRMAKLETGELANDLREIGAAPAGTDLARVDTPEGAAAARLSQAPFYNSRLRTTCVPTRLEAGHADNALPQLATALINCRLMPGDSADQVRGTLVRVLGDDQIAVRPLGAMENGPVGQPGPELMRIVERVTEAQFPGVPVVPVMSSGATDGRFLRAAGIPTYGVSGLFGDVDDVRAHGRDERILVQAFFEAQQFGYELVRALAAKP